MSTSSTNNVNYLFKTHGIDNQKLNFTINTETSQLHESSINTNKAKSIGSISNV
jgi:hypothetical protein